MRVTLDISEKYDRFLTFTAVKEGLDDMAATTGAFDLEKGNVITIFDDGAIIQEAEHAE